MSTKWSFQYVSAACPELSKAEIEVLIEQLYSDSRYESATKNSIQELAGQLFPGIYRHRQAVTNEYVCEAMELIERAASLLARVPNKTEEMARTELEARNNVIWLKKEIGEA